MFGLGSLLAIGGTQACAAQPPVSPGALVEPGPAADPVVVPVVDPHTRWLSLAPTNTFAMARVSNQAVAESPYGEYLLGDSMLLTLVAADIHFADDDGLGAMGRRALEWSTDTVLGMSMPPGGAGVHVCTVVGGTDPNLLSPSLRDAERGPWESDPPVMRSGEAVAVPAPGVGWIFGSRHEQDELVQAALEPRASSSLHSDARAMAARTRFDEAAVAGILWFSDPLRVTVQTQLAAADVDPGVLDQVRGFGVYADLHEDVEVTFVALVANQTRAEEFAQLVREFLEDVAGHPLLSELGLSPSLVGAAVTVGDHEASVRVVIEQQIAQQALVRLWEGLGLWEDHVRQRVAIRVP